MTELAGWDEPLGWAELAGWDDPVGWGEPDRQATEWDEPVLLAPSPQTGRSRLRRPVTAAVLAVAVVGAVGTADAPAGSSSALPGSGPGAIAPGHTGPGVAGEPGVTIDDIPVASVPGLGNGPITVQPASIASALPDERAQIAVRVAMAQIGLPYVWGGDGPQAGDAGFDCSGLTHFAYDKAGIDLPRTAHTQFYAGPRVPDGAPLQPGDLVFYGTYRKVHHVGMYIGQGRMVNAPTFGEPVQTAWYRWSGDDYVGATRPASSGLGTGPVPGVPPVPAPDAPPTNPVFVAPRAPLPSVLTAPDSPQPPEAGSAAQSRAGAAGDIAAGRDPVPESPTLPTPGTPSPTKPPAGTSPAPGGGPEGGPDPGTGTTTPPRTSTPGKPPSSTGPQPGTPPGQGTPTRPSTPKPTPTPSKPPATPPPASTTPTPPKSTPPPKSTTPTGTPAPPSTTDGPALVSGGTRVPLKTVDTGADGLPEGTGLAGSPGKWIVQLSSSLSAAPGTPVSLLQPDGKTVRYTVATRSAPGPRAAAADADAPLVILVPAGDGRWTVLTAR